MSPLGSDIPGRIAQRPGYPVFLASQRLKKSHVAYPGWIADRLSEFDAKHLGDKSSPTTILGTSFSHDVCLRLHLPYICKSKQHQPSGTRSVCSF